jgi:hypothetical protein
MTNRCPPSPVFDATPQFKAKNTWVCPKSVYVYSSIPKQIVMLMGTEIYNL